MGKPIQARRIVEAAAGLKLAVDPVGLSQVMVKRAARRIDLAEIERAVKGPLELQRGLDARTLSVVFDTPPVLLVAPEVKAPVLAEDIAFDRRSRRVAATVSVGEGPARRASARVTASVAELVEVAVLNRAVSRGQTVQASDFVLERRVKDALPTDILLDPGSIAARVARRTLGAGAVLRSGDIARPEVIARGEIVTVVYEIPGLTLTLRGRATEAGALGEMVNVQNLQSKKTLQATVLAPGKVSVGTPTPGRLAANANVPASIDR